MEHQDVPRYTKTIYLPHCELEPLPYHSQSTSFPTQVLKTCYNSLKFESRVEISEAKRDTEYGTESKLGKVRPEKECRNISMN
jgi:hypothetical protein